MAVINVEHINPFLSSAVRVLQDFGVTAKIGKPSVKQAELEKDSVLIMIGVTGEMKGQVLIAFCNKSACAIAAKMMMMPAPASELDAMSQSAICELGNMILGNAATIFSTKGIKIDITPPAICFGDVRFTSVYAANICVPIALDDGNEIEINVSVKGD